MQGDHNAERGRHGIDRARGDIDRFRLDINIAGLDVVAIAMMVVFPTAMFAMIPMFVSVTMPVIVIGTSGRGGAEQQDKGENGCEA